MPLIRVVVLTSLAMIAFAGNSLLCRVALKETGIDAASFTTIRLVSGGIILWLIVHRRVGSPAGTGNWPSAVALFAYAAAYSFAYGNLSAATGALILFGAVQVTMTLHGALNGESLVRLQLIGILLAFGGLIGLLLPGLSAPPVLDSILMMGAGVAWGVYSLRGRGLGDPTRVTAGNFIRTIPITLVLSLLTINSAAVDVAGFVYAVLSGALTSGIGYAIWYAVLPDLKATSAATLQLSVPVIVAIGGILFLDEPITLRLIFASVAILGGIALVILRKQNIIDKQQIR